MSQCASQASLVGNHIVHTSWPRLVVRWMFTCRWISDKYGQERMMMAGCIVTAISFFLVGPMPLLQLPPANIPILMFALTMMGAGSCMVFVPALSAMMAVGTTRFGKAEGLEDVISGLLNSSYYLGGGIAPMVSGALTEQVGFATCNTYFGLAMLIHFCAMLISAQALPVETSEDQGPLLSGPLNNKASPWGISARHSALQDDEEASVPIDNPLSKLVQMSTLANKRTKAEVL